MNIFEILNLRYEFEEIVRNYKVNSGINKHGTLDSMKDFLETAGKRNIFKDGFFRAEEICKMIVDHEEKRVPFS